ncbi:MAG: DUF167 domain-containing protein [Pseudomonadota bacterium]
MEWPIKETEKGLVCHIIVQPRSSCNKITGVHNGALKIKITAPPVEGAANTCCVKYLASLLKIAPGNIEIIAGHNSRNKQVRIKSISRKELESLLDGHTPF